MPRQHPFSSLAMGIAEPNASLGVTAAAFLLLCAFMLMACASHSGRRWRLTGRRSSDPVISIHQVQPGANGSRDVCLWQKGILMGEKCQLPDFSGIITYDSAGNLIAPGRPCLTDSLK